MAWVAEVKSWGRCDGALAAVLAPIRCHHLPWRSPFSTCAWGSQALSGWLAWIPLGGSAKKRNNFNQAVARPLERNHTLWLRPFLFAFASSHILIDLFFFFSFFLFSPSSS
jgi:hypothetical protein